MAGLLTSLSRYTLQTHRGREERTDQHQSFLSVVGQGSHLVSKTKQVHCPAEPSHRPSGVAGGTCIPHQAGAQTRTKLWVGLSWHIHTADPTQHSPVLEKGEAKAPGASAGRGSVQPVYRGRDFG